MVIWLPWLFVAVVHSDEPWFTSLLPALFVLLLANYICICWNRKKAGGRF